MPLTESISSAVSGPLPRVGDHVICQMKPAEGFASQSPYKYFGFDVRVVPPPADSRRPRKQRFVPFHSHSSPFCSCRTTRRRSTIDVS